MESIALNMIIKVTGILQKNLEILASQEGSERLYLVSFPLNVDIFSMFLEVPTLICNISVHFFVNQNTRKIRKAYPRLYFLSRLYFIQILF